MDKSSMMKGVDDNDDGDYEYYYYYYHHHRLSLSSSSSSLSSRVFSRLFICYTNLTSKSEPSRNQWPYFGVPKERSFVRLTHERFYFLKLNLKINSVLLMLKRIFFCTFLLLVIYRVSCYNLSLLFVCYHNIHIQGKTVKNCSEID